MNSSLIFARLTWNRITDKLAINWQISLKFAIRVWLLLVQF